MILQCAAQVPTEDWRRMKAYAMSALGICSGLRPKELRLVKLKDLDLNHGMMHAEEVKEKGWYGEPRDSAIHPDGPIFLRCYLQAHAQALMGEYLTSDLLFPSLQNLQKGRSGVFSINGTTDLRSIVKEETGVEFDLQACRRTWGQVGIDSGVPIDVVSRMMGHASTKTTETFYARKKNDKAIAEARRVWNVAITPEQTSQT
jgi:integrase